MIARLSGCSGCCIATAFSRTKHYGGGGNVKGQNLGAFNGFYVKLNKSDI